MKRTVLLSLGLITLWGSVFLSHGLGNFPDISGSDWFAGDVAKLASACGIAGYPDGTFRPTATITRGECAFMVAQALGIKATGTPGTRWPESVMTASEKAGLIKAGEFTDATAPITRYELARLAIRALEYKKEAVPADYAEYGSLIFDGDKSPAYGDDVIKALSVGILSGYSDRTFKGLQAVSRAEAASVTLRIIDTSARKVPMKPSPCGEIRLYETKAASELISNLSQLTKDNPGLKTVTLVGADTLTISLETGASGARYLHVPGHLGRIIAMKNGRFSASFPGVYMAPEYTYFPEAEMMGKLESFDYFGFIPLKPGPEITDIELVANPWKE